MIAWKELRWGDAGGGTGVGYGSTRLGVGLKYGGNGSVLWIGCKVGRVVGW